MKKLQLITIFILFLCAISVSAAPSFNITEDFVNQTSSAGLTLNTGLSFTVNNNGTTNLNINFTGYELTSGSNKLYISSLNNITNMLDGTSQNPTFSVVIPTQQRPGKYTGTLTATSNATPSTTIEDSLIINVNVTPTYSASASPSEINLESATLNATYTKTFDITNTGNDDITNVYFAFSKSGFNLNSNKTNFTLAFNAAESIKFNITIPADFSTGNVTLGSVNLVSTQLNTALFDVKANVGGGLEIEDLDVFLTTRKGKSGSDLDVYDGRKLKFGDENAGPESEIRFDFNIENTFADQDNVDINNIIVKVTIEGIDDGKDIEEESAEFDLEPTANEDAGVIIKIPLSVDAGVYDVLIEAEGEDDSGNAHTAQMSLKVDINKEARDIIISKAELFPAIIKCSGSSTLTAAIKNIGRKIEKEAKLEITNNDLGINFVQKNIELEEDPFGGNDEFTKNLLISIDKNTKAGTYPITVKSYLQEEILWETKIANFVVEACDQVEEKKEAVEEIKEITETEPVEAGKEAENEIIEGEEIPVLEPTTTTEVPLTKKPLFWIAIALLNVIVIGGVAFFVVKLVGKKQ